MRPLHIEARKSPDSVRGWTGGIELAAKVKQRERTTPREGVRGWGALGAAPSVRIHNLIDGNRFLRGEMKEAWGTVKKEAQVTHSSDISSTCLQTKAALRAQPIDLYSSANETNAASQR